VRLHRSPEQPLTPYERRILDVLHRRASDGVVPAQALTTGPADESKRWWRSFVGEVVEDAQRRGLSRDIWDGRTIRRLAVLAAFPAPLVWLAFGFQPTLFYAALAAAFLGGIKNRNRQRDTPAGYAAASRWLGVRATLDEDEAFPTLPPIAVALWERHLAYGAALGVAAAAVRAIPMGAESNRRAWSSYGGRWRQVRVRYPRLLPLAWGADPLKALLRWLVALVAAAAALFLLASLIGFGDLHGVEAAIVAGVVVVLLAVIGVAATVVLRAAADLGSTTQVTGEILRLRRFGSDDSPRYYVAVDDGSSEKLRAWRVRSEIFEGLEQHELVIAALTPRLRYVRSIDPVPVDEVPRQPARGSVRPARSLPVARRLRGASSRRPR
jgi:hypothetical protein